MMFHSKAMIMLTLFMGANSVAAVALDVSSPYPHYASDKNGKMRVLVGYNGDRGHESIVSQTVVLQSEGMNVNELKNHEFKRAHKVTSFVVEDVEGWAQEGAMSTGYSVLEFDSSDVNAGMEALKNIPGVVSVELDAVVHASSTSTPTQNLRGERSGAQDHMEDVKEAIKTTTDQFLGSVNVKANHGFGRRLEESIPYGIDMVQSVYVNAKPDPVGAQPITICVVDSGYDLGHVDLPDTSHGVDGYSPYGIGELWDVDGFGHGTHCAGTIGAIGGNNIGVTSVNPDPTKFKFYIGKGLKNSGNGTYSGAMDAINKCVENDAKVISMSIGGKVNSPVFDNLMKDHYDSGILLIAAAGNGGSSAPLSYPASYKTVVSVAAVDSNKNRAGFSETNDQVELSAPGVSVQSTLPGDGYGYKDGTSMATPHVAGVAALLTYHYANCTNNQIRNVMILGSEDLGAPSWDPGYGWGLVNAKAAYDLLESQGCEAGGPFPAEGQHLSDMAFGGKDQLLSFLTPAPTQAPTPMPTNEGDSGPQSAFYDPSFGAPRCSFGYSCDSEVLLNGRGNVMDGEEPNQPNTLNSCTDGHFGIYHIDESIDKIVVSQAPGITSDMTEGDTVTITATVWCWENYNGASDYIDFYYASDASNLEWTQIGERQQCPGGGAQTVTAEYILPEGEIQAVRVNLMFGSSPESPNNNCTTGNYDDTDDVVIAVKSTSGPTPPPSPTSLPTHAPSTAIPSYSPTEALFTASPSSSPMQAPSTASPSSSPTHAPSTASPSSSPTHAPSTASPSSTPTHAPSTASPSSSPTHAPSTASPSSSPTHPPSTTSPSPSPTHAPSTASPTKSKPPLSSPPTEAETTTPPTHAPTQSSPKEFKTPDLDKATEDAKGIMYSITAKSKEVTITGFGIMGKKSKAGKTSKASNVEIKIYYQDGLYDEFNAFDEMNWNQVYNGKTVLDPDELTIINLDGNFTISANASASVYVLSRKGMLYKSASGAEFDEYAESDDLMLRVGMSTKKKFKKPDKLVEFAGSIVYET